jgi:CRISPR-associated protein Cas1
MRRLLNVLFVTAQGAYLHRERESVLVEVDGKTMVRVPVHTLEGVICFGQVFVSPPVMQLCAERGANISFLSRNGRFWARVQGPVSGNVLLRRAQYRWADDEERCAAIARAMVIAKISNSRAVLQRYVRSHVSSEGINAVSDAIAHLGELVKGLKTSQPLATLRGVEGEAARRYFNVLRHLILTQKEGFPFQERTRRPPLDNMNALLSFVYTLLVHDVSSALESVGLDPAVGFLHRDRPGRPGLALDLMEELRPYIADRLVLSLVNLKQVTPDGFQKTETGAVNMTEETRRLVIRAYQERKREEMTHPFLKEKIQVGLLPYTQALLLTRHIRGDMDGYPPFLWR